MAKEQGGVRARDGWGLRDHISENSGDEGANTYEGRLLRSAFVAKMKARHFRMHIVRDLVGMPLVQISAPSVGRPHHAPSPSHRGHVSLACHAGYDNQTPLI